MIIKKRNIELSEGGPSLRNLKLPRSKLSASIHSHFNEQVKISELMALLRTQCQIPIYLLDTFSFTQKTQLLGKGRQVQ